MINNYKQRIKTYLTRRITSLICYEQLLTEHRLRIKERNNRQVSLGVDSVLYEQSVVYNLSHNPEKIRIGHGTHVRGELLLFAAGGEITIGDNCYVGEGTRIWSMDQIVIGDNVLISHNCNVIDTDSHEI